MSNNQVYNWIKNQKQNNKLKIKKKNKFELNQWNFDNKSIYHKKNFFFKIIPFKFNQQNKNWFQPLIIQKEEGILGIIKKIHGGISYYLLQAKPEPGNINNIQISPTVQATKSNYQRKHGGKKTKFLDFFIKKKNSKNIKKLSSLKLSEQGTRFLQKKNRNILIQINNMKIRPSKNFRWMTKENIKFLLRKKNILNMDTISVLSSIIEKDYGEKTINDFNFLKRNLKNFKTFLKIKKKQITFSRLKYWYDTKFEIFDLKKKFFSILFLDVLTNGREVKKWDQPIVSDHSNSLNGFIVSKYNNTNHYLLKVIQEPGFSSPKYTCTISVKNSLSENLKKIKYYNFFHKKKYNLNIINSDEGGRFFKNQTKNLISCIKNYKKVKLHKRYIWASHNQIIKLINENLLTIEARILFTCYNIDKIR